MNHGECLEQVGAAPCGPPRRAAQPVALRRLDGTRLTRPSPDPPPRRLRSRLQVFAFFKPYLSRAHNMSWTSWSDYMTRIALKSNRECEARLPTLLLLTARSADTLEASAEKNLVSAALAAGVLSAAPPARAEQPSDAQPWFVGHAELLQVVDSVHDGAMGNYDADVESYEYLRTSESIRRTGASTKVVKRIIKLFHQVELAVYFRAHDLSNRRSGARARPS